jgi:hypothetical protein
MDRMKKFALLALVAVLLIAATALATVFVYRALVEVSVVVEPGTSGLTVAPTQLNFGTMAIGDWSSPQPLTVTNIGTQTLTGLTFASSNSQGVGFFSNIPPFMALAPGDSLTFPVQLFVQETTAPGDYRFSVTVSGVK